MAAELAVRWPERVAPDGAREPGGALRGGRADHRDLRSGTRPSWPTSSSSTRSIPIAQLMRAMDGMARRDPSQIPFELVRPDPAGPGGDGQGRVEPLPARPQAAGPAAPDHGARPSSSTPAQDGIVPRAHAEAYASAIPDARLVDLDDAAHLAALERPDEVAKLVVEHLGS